MKMETAAVLFLVSRSYLLHTRRCTYDSNEHAYGMWRQILREFNMEQIVRISDKQRLKMKSILESNILTSSSTSDFNGHQETYPDFVARLKEVASIVTTSDPINVDPDIPAVI